MKEILEFTATGAIFVLMVIFASLYFVGTKKQKKLNASSGSGKPEDGIIAEWAEQLRIINAQLDLIFQLSPAFIVCYDYGRSCFYISENGRLQLGYAHSDDSGETDRKKFESLIHPDYIDLYGEVTNFEDIRKYEVADSPYIVKIRNSLTGEYGEYLMRVKPIYDGDGMNKALVAAFINTAYIVK